MKVLRISLLLLMAFSLMTGICYAQTAKDYYDKGIEHGVAGEFEKAQQEFREALRVDPFYRPAKKCLEMIEDVLTQRIKTETALHIFKGVAYGTKGMHDEAIAELKKAIKINPNYAGPHHSLGLVYANKGMYDEAIAEFKKAIKINPSDPKAHYNLGEAYCRKGMYDEAIAEYKRAIDIDPNLAEAHNELGIAYYDKGMKDEAIAKFKRAIDIDPEFALAHNNLAVVYYYKGEYSLAVKYCDRATELRYRVNPKFLELLEPYRERGDEMSIGEAAGKVVGALVIPVLGIIGLIVLIRKFRKTKKKLQKEKAKRNPGVAVVLSLLWCGVGQIYNGQLLKGILFILFYGLLMSAAIRSLRSYGGVITFIFPFILWIIGIVDGYNTAKKINIRLSRFKEEGR